MLNIYHLSPEWMSLREVVVRDGALSAVNNTSTLLNREG